MSGQILIVDDEPQALHEMVEFLQRRQFDVAGTSDPRVALDAITRGDSLAAVITDLKMPHIDGFCIIAAARDRRLSIVVAITGHATESDERHAIRCGATHFFSKPLDLSAILNEFRMGGIAPKHVHAEKWRAKGRR